MVEKTFIKGKDACLEESILRMQSLLQAAGFDIEEVSWLNPVPNVYSVHLRDRNCPTLFTNGKGASRKATLASALGEFFERLETNYFFSDFYLEPSEDDADKAPDWLYFPDEKTIALEDFKSLLTPSLWAIYEADGDLSGDDFLSLNDSVERIRCLPLRQARSGEIVYFPMNLLSNLYASNGLSAGNTPQEALVQGLSEVFERWVKQRILTENLCLPEVPEALIQQFPTVVAARTALQAEGLAVSIRDASLGGAYPVMNVTLLDRKSGRCFASFGAHPMFEVALERTLTESLQGRRLEQLDGFQTPVFDAERVAEDENIENHFIDSSGLIHARFISRQYDFEFVHWDFEGDTSAQLENLLQRFDREGRDVFYAEYNHFGVPACRILVPGVSEVFPRHELLEDNQNRGRALREQLAALMVSKAPNRFEAAYDAIEAMGFSEHQGVANLIGLRPDPGSYWQKLKMIELQMWLALASGDYETALDALQTSLYFVDDPEWHRLYIALEFGLEVLLQSDLETYPVSVQADLFGEALTERVWRCIRGEELFGGLPMGAAAFQESRSHRGLLQVYRRVQAVKAKAWGAVG
ncbi:MAG: 30S ribosomal protein S12 methylthiotransferase accessory factor YcaO [Hydrogenovibrio sp.]